MSFAMVVLVGNFYSGPWKITPQLQLQYVCGMSNVFGELSLKFCPATFKIAP